VYQYFCVIINGTQYSISQSGYAVYGIGARLANNGWLRFAPYNLGATGTNLSIAEQMAYQPSAGSAGEANDARYDPTVYGSWYQWGRVKDGHELRTTLAANTYADLLNETAGLATSFLDPTTGQVTTGDAVGKFVQRNAGTNDWRLYPETDDNSALAPANAWTWGDPNDLANDPCRSEMGSPWRVPTQTEWAQIAANNSWSWKVAGTSTAGYEIKTTAGKPTSLFLPAAGSRNRNGGDQGSAGTYGDYWSSTTSGTMSYYLFFSSSKIQDDTTTSRASGYAVRCVAE
jgi:uncharacterized protein (TIGR02145 family)